MKKILSLILCAAIFATMCSAPGVKAQNTDEIASAVEAMETGDKKISGKHVEVEDTDSNVEICTVFNTIYRNSSDAGYVDLNIENTVVYSAKALASEYMGVNGNTLFDIYVVDPKSDLSFTACNSLTQEGINEVLANCGSTSQIRKNIISSALSQVGKLPYYYGGKPTSGSIPIMTNYGKAGSYASVPDHIGRTTAGLDCFGFCQWAYWNATGSNILPEGSEYTTTEVYNSTSCGNLTRLSSASDLRIGDLGFKAGHVGIFAGVSAKGKLMWIHCNGSANTVSHSTYNGFTRFYRLNGLD